jgi:VanZ family protein
MNRIEYSGKCAALRIIVLLLWVTGVLWLSLTPSPPSLSSDLLSWDKLRHAAAYALMTLLAGRVFVLFALTPRRGWIWAAVFALAFGGLTEAAQGMLSEVRQAEFGDMLANAGGAVIVLATVFARTQLTKRRKL